MKGDDATTLAKGPVAPALPTSAGGWTPRNIYTLGMLTLIYSLNTVDRNLFGLLVPQIKTDLGLSDTAIGLLSGFVFAAFYATAALPIASLADRWNRRNIIAIGLAFWSVMTALHGVVRDVWQLALTRFLLGAGEATSVAPSNSIVADLFGPTQRPFALGFLAASASFGLLFAFPLLGHISGEYGWRAAFVAAGIPGTAVALIFFLTVREPQRGTSGRAGEQVPLSLSEALQRLLATPAFVLAACAGTLVSFEMAVMHTWMPAFLSRVHGLSQAEIGSFIGFLRGFGGIIGGIGGGWLASRLGRRNPRWHYRVPALAMMLAAPALLCVVFGGDLVWKFGLAFETLMVMAQIGPLFAMLLAAVEARMRAVAIAAFLFISNLVGQTSGPLVSGAISDALAATVGQQAIGYAMLAGAVAVFAAGALCFAAGRGISDEHPSEERA
jgi:predicted MFS family arabinose efflux permease